MVYWFYMGSSFTASDIAVIIITLIVSLVIHEYMHGFVAHLLGDSTAKDEGRLSLNPLRHIDPYMTILLPLVTLVVFHFPFLAAKPVPFNPARVKYDEFGAALVAAAGPFSNLLLAIVGAIFANHVFASGSFLETSFATFTVLNVALFVFNLLPIPPLDGSRVLYAFSPEPLQRFMQTIEPYGFFIIFALVLYAGVGGFLGTLNNAVLSWLP